MHMAVLGLEDSTSAPLFVVLREPLNHPLNTPSFVWSWRPLLRQGGRSRAPPHAHGAGDTRGKGPAERQPACSPFASFHLPPSTAPEPSQSTACMVIATFQIWRGGGRSRATAYMIFTGDNDL